MLWQGRDDDVIRIGEEGLALLGDDTESVEAALMNQRIAVGHLATRRTKFRELTYRTAQFIQCLPYSPELMPAYTHIVIAYAGDKDVEAAMKWIQALEERAASHHDLTALGGASLEAGRNIIGPRGDLHGAISQFEQALELFARIGDAKERCHCLVGIVDAFLSLGDIQRAEEYVGRGLEIAEAIGSKGLIAWYYARIGRIALCQGDRESAMGACQKAIQLYREVGGSEDVRQSPYTLGRTYLAQGDRVSALRQFHEAFALMKSEELRGYVLPPFFFTSSRHIASALSGLEAAYDDATAFRAFCQRSQEEHAKAGDSPFVQWFLEPADVGAVRPVPCPCRTGQGLVAPGPLVQGQRVQDQCEPPLHHDEFSAPLSPDWNWEDPFGDCSFTVQDGLEVHAANGRDLYHINLSAPRLLRAASGDLVVQTICAHVSDDRPAIGGLLLWKDKENYLRLDRGMWGEHEVLFGGCLGNEDVIVGRGCLPLDSSSRVYLRLERVGERVNALCSADGERWFTVGHVVFSVEDPIQVGLHAIGHIDRCVYHGAYPDGTAIRFESFQLWGLDR